MPGCNCEKENFLKAYQDEVAQVKQLQPDLDAHAVRLSVAEVLRPRFLQDMDSGKTESSGEKEYLVKDKFTVTPDGRALWVGYGRYWDELEDRTDRLTPGKYERSDKVTTSAIITAIKSGANRIVTSYARSDGNSRDLIEITYDRETNRGTMRIINTGADGQHNDFQGIQQFATERFTDLKKQQISQTTFLLTDVDLPQTQSSTVRLEIRESPVVQHIEQPQYHEDVQQRIVTADHAHIPERQQAVTGQIVDTAIFAGRKTVTEVGITVKQVRERIRVSMEKRKNRKMFSVDLGVRSLFTKDNRIRKKHRQNRPAFEGKKIRERILFKTIAGKKESVLASKKRKKLARHSAPERVVRTEKKRKSFEYKKLYRRKINPLFLENVMTSKEANGKSRKKKGRFLMGERKDHHIYKRKTAIEKNKYKKELKVRAMQYTETRAKLNKPEVKRTRLFHDVLVRLARRIHRKKESQDLRNPVRYNKNISELHHYKHKKEKKRMIVLQFSFAWLLYRLSHVEKNLKRPSLIVTPQDLDTLSVNKDKRQDEGLKKQEEATPWVLLSIIWYLTMIREGGISMSNFQYPISNKKQKVNHQSKIQTNTAPFIFIPMPQQAVIFAYHS